MHGLVRPATPVSPMSHSNPVPAGCCASSPSNTASVRRAAWRPVNSRTWCTASWRHLALRPWPQPRPGRSITRPAAPIPCSGSAISALTFSGHRIHHDHDYATRVEAYPDLVCHGHQQARPARRNGSPHHHGQLPARFTCCRRCLPTANFPSTHRTAMPAWSCGSPTPPVNQLSRQPPSGDRTASRRDWYVQYRRPPRHAPDLSLPDPLPLKCALPNRSFSPAPPGGIPAPPAPSDP